jgi:hypothetical protein
MKGSRLANDTWVKLNGIYIPDMDIAVMDVISRTATFRAPARGRYSGFLISTSTPPCEFLVDILGPRASFDIDADRGCRVTATNEFARVLDYRELK